MESQINKSLASKKNNFDLIRFFAAVLVVWFHSFPLTGTSNDEEPIMRFSMMQTTSGELGVIIFFLISGFLITMSFERRSTFVRFFKARILRIMPAFIIVILLTVFIIGPLLTTKSMYEYFHSSATYRYLANISLKHISYELPGVFTGNLYPNAVNGSIWTLWYEFFFYIVVAVLGIAKLLNKYLVTFLWLAVCVLMQINFPHGYQYIYFAVYFFAGMCFYLWRDKVSLNYVGLAIAVVLLAVSAHFGFLKINLAFCGAYILFFLALGPVAKFPDFTKYGDLSYGIYIYSFLVQQIVVQAFANHLTQMQNFIYSLVISMVCAFLSWHLVEKQCMKLKNRKIIKLKKSTQEEGAKNV